MAKKPNPQDATRRNVRAANDKIRKLTLRVRALEARYKEVLAYLSGRRKKS